MTPPAVPAAESTADSVHQVTVVVVDDHPVVRDGLLGMFAGEPRIRIVGQAADGREASVVVKASDPDVVLLDLRMPQPDGVETIRTLRAASKVRPRVLVLTTYAAERDIRAAMDAGAEGYLLKDTPRDDLVRAVVDVAAGRPVLAKEALEALTGRRPGPELTAREIEVLAEIAAGGTNRSAARRLMVSEATVKTHLVHAYEKLGVGDRAAAVRAAFERGLL